MDKPCLKAETSLTLETLGEAVDTTPALDGGNQVLDVTLVAEPPLDERPPACVPAEPRASARQIASCGTCPWRSGRQWARSRR